MEEKNTSVWKGIGLAFLVVICVVFIIKVFLGSNNSTCPTGYILGNDTLCHPTCVDSNHYCITGTCFNNQCVTCPSGLYLGTDGKCYLNINTNSSSLTILNSNLGYGEYGNVEITGTAKNTGGSELSYAQVDANFYDSSGDVIGSSLANINNLGADETWKFTIYYPGTDYSDVNSYNISVGSIW